VKHVAVVAVHGVADQKPGETVHQAAEMLLRHRDPEGRFEYASASESGLTIRVAPVRLRKRVVVDKGRGLVDQRSEALRAFGARRSLARQAASEEGWGATEHEKPSENATDLWLNRWEMREQLQGYEARGADSVYQTTQLRTRRRERTGSNHVVDVYEMYWADLSRLGDRVIGVFFDFYQLLFFLCGLGTASLDRAAAHSRHWTWALTRWLHGIAEAILVLAVPILNLALLALATALAASWIPVSAEQVAFPALPALIVATGVGLLIFLKRRAFKATLWPGWFLILAAPLAAALFAKGWLGARAFVLCLWLVAVLLLVRLLRTWNSTRRGALTVGLFVMLLLTAVYVFELFFSGKADDPNGVFEAAHATVQVILGWEAVRGGDRIRGLLGVSWGFFFAFALLTTLASFAATLLGSKPPHREAARRAAWTANLTLALPGFVVLVVNIALWRALVRLGAMKLAFVGITLIPELHREKVQDLVDGATLPYLPWLLLAAGLALFGLFWSLLPAIRGESTPPSLDRSETEWLGRSLSAAFAWMRLHGEIIRLLVVVVIPAILVASAVKGDQRSYSPVVLAVGLLIFVAVTGSHGPFRFLALGFRAALDIALDVANWLRLDPREATPRARICARYVSLLRHVCTWRDPQSGEGYSRLVILAHSQGTVITADLFRFLRHEAAADPDLARLFDPQAPNPIEIRFFTMGCPLRQLFGRRFPYRYGWARDPVDQKPGGLPDPAPTGAVMWSNAYRSGDYVGRQLWQDPTGPTVWNPAPAARWDSPNGDRSDFCIGSGAHTHYWDDTAPRIGAELDRLIS
jgi:hypothetical protein